MHGETPRLRRRRDEPCQDVTTKPHPPQNDEQQQRIKEQLQTRSVGGRPVTDEGDRLQRQIDYALESLARTDAEVERLRVEMPQIIKTAVREAVPEVILSADEQRSLRLLIQRQEQGIKLRQAIIEKSLTALMWAAIVGVAVVIKEYMIAHGMWRP
jgi:hypothetical protein